MEDCGKVFLPIISYKSSLARLLMAKAHKTSMGMKYYGEKATLRESKAYVWIIKGAPYLVKL